MAYTGVGATFAISAGATFTGRITRIGEFTKTREALDDTALSSTICREVVPDDLDTNEPIEIEYTWDDASEKQVPIGTPCTLTLTFPGIPGGSSTTVGGVIQGTGFFTSASYPVLEPGVRLKAAATWQFDGKTTKPTYTNSGV